MATIRRAAHGCSVLIWTSDNSRCSIHYHTETENITIMKNRYFVLLLSSVILCLTSCHDWLTEPGPGVTELDDFFTSGKAAEQTVTAAYVPLLWEYNGTYFSEWFIGDIMSDDALKGGQNIGDMADAYDMENWKTNTNNGLLLSYYRAQFQGVGRANLVLDQVGKMRLDSTLQNVPKDYHTNVQDRLMGEAYFLRAFYYFRLLRVFGAVPKVNFVIDSSDKWSQPAATVDELFKFIVSDLEEAQKRLWPKAVYETPDWQHHMGRATKEAAEAMLQKTYLYMASPYWQQKRGTGDASECYSKSVQWGDSIVEGGHFVLADYATMFTLAGENGSESIFEIQYMAEQTSDYGEGYGYSRGTFTTILTRSRASAYGGGWGFDHPTHNLYNEFEEDDIRRHYSIFEPDEDKMDVPVEEFYLGTSYLNRKTMYADGFDEKGSMPSLDHASRGPNNNRQIRYADVLLMQAEALAELGNEGEATIYLNQVRTARNMPPYPDYTYTTTTPSTGNALKDAIRHERRVELAMESHRWFDLVRWGIAKEAFDAYKATETEEARAEMNEFIKGKHELLPIPSEEIDLQPDLKNGNGWY